ncbi:MAG: ABC transporter substrate-binding protein [Actinomycetota bacterium]
MRIVSLLPSTTEIVFQLGLAEQLFGVTFECNFPPEARKGRAIVVGGMDTAHLDPKEIDELVRARMAAGEDLYALDEEALSRCDPDLILSQDLCRVCAVSSGNVDEAVAKLGCRAQVLQIDPQTLDEVIDSVQTVADAAGVADRGRELVAQLRARLARLQDAVAATRRRTETPAPRVFVLEWTDPPFVGGHWVPDVVAAAGGLPVLSRPGEKSVSATWDEIRAVDPDIVVVSPCGYGLSGAEAQGRSVLGQLPERAQVFAIDADAVMVRPGPRLVDGAEALAVAFFGPDVLGMSALPRDLISRLR